MKERTPPQGCIEISPGNLYNIQEALHQFEGLILVSGYPRGFSDFKEEAFFDLYLKPKIFTDLNKRKVDEEDRKHPGRDLSFVLNPGVKDSGSLEVGNSYKMSVKSKYLTALELFHPFGTTLYLPKENKSREAFEFCLYRQILRIDQFRKESKKPETGITDEHIEQMLNFVLAHMHIEKQETATQ